MLEAQDLKIELSELLYDANIDGINENPNEENEDYIKSDDVMSLWFINIIPRKTIPCRSVTKREMRIEKRYKFRRWGFKNEFLKSYNFLIENKTFDTLPANEIKCPYCTHKEENCELFYVESSYGNFCWGTLLSHLILVHDFKPVRFFIEYIYYLYCRFVYGESINIVKLDENTLNHFEIMSRLGHEKKININNIDYEVKYFGNIILKCGNLESNLPSVKSRIKNIGVYFGNMAIVEDENKSVLSVGPEIQYNVNLINYLYFVRPYDVQERFLNISNENPTFEIPTPDEYVRFKILSKIYPNLLGLLIFVNEGIYVISKLDLEKEIEYLEEYFDMPENKEAYNQYYDLITEEYSIYLEIYKTETHKEILTEEDKKKCYEFYQNMGSWVDLINEYIKLFNLKITYFPKITVEKINDKYNVRKNKLIYDTIYLPINQCIDE